MIQTILGRGDERLNDVILNVYQQGGIFQEWSEFFISDRWKKAAEISGVNIENYLKPLGFDQILPWDFIDIGVSKDFLKKEYSKAKAGEKTEDCASGQCSDCGVCAGTPKIVIPTNQGAETTTNLDYGRLPRKITGYEEIKTRFRIKYSVGENFRYASHLDLVRAFYRALRRSELPIAYTQGFSPRPLVSFGPPLPVGVCSAGEYLDFQMAHHYSGNIVHDFVFFLPRDIRILAARPINRKTDSLGKIINLAKYEIELTSQIDVKQTIAKKEQIMGIHQLDFYSDKKTCTLFLQIAPKIKLFDSIQQLLSLDENQVRCLRIERKDCYSFNNGKVITPMEVI